MKKTCLKNGTLIDDYFFVEEIDFYFFILGLCACQLLSIISLNLGMYNVSIEYSDWLKLYCVNANSRPQNVIAILC